MNTYKKSILAIGAALALTSGMAFANTSSSAVGSVTITAVCSYDSKSDGSQTVANVFGDDTASFAISTAFKNNKTGGTVSVTPPASLANASGDETLEFTSSGLTSEADGGNDAAYIVTRTETVSLSNLKAKKADTYTGTFIYICTPGA